MATNEIFDRGQELALVATDPTTPASCDPILVGQIPAVAVAAKDATTGKTPCKMEGVFDLSVKAVDGGGNSAVAVGDIIYYVSADTPKLSKKTSRRALRAESDAKWGGRLDMDAAVYIQVSRRHCYEYPDDDSGSRGRVHL